MAALAALLVASWISSRMGAAPAGTPAPPRPPATAPGPSRVSVPVEPERYPPPAPGAGGPEGADPGEVSVFEIDRQVIDALDGLEEAVAGQARVVPVLGAGTPNGFRILGVRPGSFYSQMGFRHGDLVRRVNGSEVDTAEIALELLRRLRDSGCATLELERDGLPIRNEYAVVAPGG